MTTRAEVSAARREALAALRKLYDSIDWNLKRGSTNEWREDADIEERRFDAVVRLTLLTAEKLESGK